MSKLRRESEISIKTKQTYKLQETTKTFYPKIQAALLILSWTTPVFTSCFLVKLIKRYTWETEHERNRARRESCEFMESC